MPERATIEEFLAQRHVAFVGVSRDTHQFANSVYRRLRKGDRVLYPVNALAGGAPIESDASFTSLSEIPGPIDGVIVMVPAAAAAAVVRDAIARGIPRVWLHRGGGKGSVSEEAVRLCHESGVAVVDGACPLMFEQPVRGVHWVHRLVSSRRVAA